MPGRMRDPGPSTAARLDALARRGSGGGSVPAAGSTRADAAAADAAATDRPVPQDAARPHPTGSTTVDDTWSVAALRRRAAELGVEGRSVMRKAELIEALRRG